MNLELVLGPQTPILFESSDGVCYGKITQRTWNGDCEKFFLGRIFFCSKMLHFPDDLLPGAKSTVRIINQWYLDEGYDEIAIVEEYSCRT